jgi:hypothetical protein
MQSPMRSAMQQQWRSPNYRLVASESGVQLSPVVQKPASSNRVNPGHLSGLVNCAPNETLRASSRSRGRRRQARDQAKTVRLR